MNCRICGAEMENARRELCPSCFREEYLRIFETVNGGFERRFDFRDEDIRRNRNATLGLIPEFMLMSDRARLNYERSLSQHACRICGRPEVGSMCRNCEETYRWLDGELERDPYGRIAREMMSRLAAAQLIPPTIPHPHVPAAVEIIRQNLLVCILAINGPAIPLTPEQNMIWSQRTREIFGSRPLAWMERQEKRTPLQEEVLTLMEEFIKSGPTFGFGPDGEMP